MPLADPSRRRVDEGLVARLWDAQHPFTLPLRTVDGEEIQVVYRGRRRFDRGPDFPAALIAFPGERLVGGDLEVHVHTSDWRRHGHHQDPNYSNVILQVVLWHDSGEPCLRHDGVVVPVVELASHLALPLESLVHADPSESPRPSPCLPGSANSFSLAELLEGRGMERFEGKVRRYVGELSCLPAEEVLYRGIADVLGYSQNREPFRRLTEMVPLSLLLQYRTSAGWEGGEGWKGGEGLLLGAAGLLPSQQGAWVDHPHVEALEETWEEDGSRWVGDSMRPEEWQFFRVRPANFPTRRVAALAMIVARWRGDGLAALLAEEVGSLDTRRVPRALEALLMGGGRQGYWAERSDFGQALPRPADLVGRQRAAEAAINLFLPFLAARADMDGDEELATRVREAYRSYPKRTDNELTRYTAVQITGLPRPAAARSACRQQGLLHVFRTWCDVKNCAQCPVVTSSTPSSGRRQRPGCGSRGVASRGYCADGS